jgi:excisionase family DNA binding protein
VESRTKKRGKVVRSITEGVKMSDYIRPAEAAKMLGVSRDTVRRYANNGDLTAIMTPGGQRRIDRESVEVIREKISSTVTVIREC